MKSVKSFEKITNFNKLVVYIELLSYNLIKTYVVDLLVTVFRDRT